MSITVRCPECGKLGSVDRNNYCQTCDPDNPVNNVCVQCGEKAFRRNAEYEGCSDDWYCKKHWEERNGPDLSHVLSDFRPSMVKPPCEQCGETGFKYDGSYVYCHKHWMARNQGSLINERYITDPIYPEKVEYEDIPGEYKIIKDNIGLVRGQ